MENMNLKLKVGAHTLELKIKGLTNSVLSGTMIALVLKLIKLFFKCFNIQYCVLWHINLTLKFQSENLQRPAQRSTTKYHP